MAMTRWEYGTLIWTAEVARASKDSWDWKHTFTFRYSTNRRASWECWGDNVLWVAAKGNDTQFPSTESVFDLIGELGWELATTQEVQRATVQDQAFGNTSYPVSFATKIEHRFKRPMR